MSSQIEPAVEAGLAILDQGGDFADGAIAYEGASLGAEEFVSFDKQAVKLLRSQGKHARPWSEPMPKKPPSRATPVKSASQPIAHAAPSPPSASPRSSKALDEAYPEAVCALTHRSPWELLVATILSAQCTDVRVNMVTPELFRRFPTPEAWPRLRCRSSRS